MVGLNTRKNQKLLAVAKSTPNDQQDGVRVKIPFAKLARYEVNVRSFHPNKQFEPLGFRFHGDDRGFSLGESWFGNPPGDVTSRIWQRYTLDMDLQSPQDLTHNPVAKHKTESNMSKPGPGGWRFLGREEKYDREELKPRGTVKATAAEKPHGGQKIMRVLSHYGGENHAFITSEYQQKYLKTTTVPTLDVFHELFVRIERVSLYMDIVSLAYGDGFPNGEGFIKDAAGNKLFLGTHVRIGFPATHLWGEQKRLMWANAVRVEIDAEGNFGEKLWVFGQVLGGPPSLRDEYPTTSEDEICSIYAKQPRIASSFNIASKERGKFTWACGDPDQIIQPKSGSTLPLHVSALDTPIDIVRSLMDATWVTGPRQKITRTMWNEYHLHRNPNEGRARDDYDLAEEKWKQANR